MKLLIIRHGDPNYNQDCLTPTGRQEAGLLAQWLENRDITALYASPLGRARQTAEITAAKKSMDVEILPWLREFPAKLRYWETDALKEACPCPWATGLFDKERIVWDILPSYWTADPNYFHPENWRQTEICRRSDTVEVYDRITGEFDAFLADHGYLRQDRLYCAQRPNRDTLALFCHFGVECVLLSHLLGISPFLLWHGFMAAPSSVTTVNTEERREGTAVFRVSSFGATPHLALGGMEPGFPGRYCECFSDDTLH